VRRNTIQMNMCRYPRAYILIIALGFLSSAYAMQRPLSYCRDSSWMQEADWKQLFKKIERHKNVQKMIATYSADIERLRKEFGTRRERFRAIFECFPRVYLCIKKYREEYRKPAPHDVENVTQKWLNEALTIMSDITWRYAMDAKWESAHDEKRVSNAVTFLSCGMPMLSTLLKDDFAENKSSSIEVRSLFFFQYHESASRYRWLHEIKNR
jgi:hypothetical protein